MAIQDPKESATSVVSELKKSSDGTNIIKEYKDMFSKEKADSSNLKDDKIADYHDGDGDGDGDGDAALDLLKAFIEEKKKKEKAGDKRYGKWDFPSSPHAHFGKTLDDTYGAFLSWARVKQHDNNDDDDDGKKVNVSKALRRLESYADWMIDTGTDLTEPPLTSQSVKDGVAAWAFKTSIDNEGRLVWWCDMGNVDIPRMKNDFAPEDHLRSFAWYVHAVMYDAGAQRNGLVFVQNCARMGMVECFTLMPAKLGTKLDRLTLGVLPIRMQQMYVFESPTWMNVFMKIVGMFMSKKMRERMVFLKDWDEGSVERIGGLDAFPKGFGKVDGKLEGSLIEETYFKS